MNLPKEGGARRSGRAGRALGLLALAFSTLLLTSCAVLLGRDDPKEEKQRLRVAVRFRSVPRYVLAVPRNEAIWLWDRPGGPAARALRVKKIPPGTNGFIVERQPTTFFTTGLREALQLSNLMEQPVRWLRVSTPMGEGWVRAEFVAPR